MEHEHKKTIIEVLECIVRSALIFNLSAAGLIDLKKVTKRPSTTKMRNRSL